MHQRVRVLCAISEARVANYSGKILITVSFDVQGNSAGGGMAIAPRRVTIRRRWSFFLLPFVSLSWSWFLCQALKNLVLSSILYLF